MSHGTAFTHLFESADAQKENDAMTEAKRTIIVNDDWDDDMVASHDAWAATPEGQRVLAEIDFSAFGALPADTGLRRDTVLSPMVRRNLDCAQYPQARGSQYEGSEW